MVRTGTLNAEEMEEITAFAMGARRPGRESMRALARYLGRRPQTVSMAVYRIVPPPQFHNLPGVMIDDFGLPHARIIDEMRKGLR